VFGLGDTSYEQYNFMGKFINEGLEELGGERVFKYGEGDANNNKTEDDFNEWKANIWCDLFKYYQENVKADPSQ
jgi:NADPH-ferrihemoprotein reductase